MSGETLKTYSVRSATTERVLHYRAGTSDWDTIQQIFRNQEYGLQRLRRGQEILDFVAVEQSVGQRPLIIDAGANIGASAVYFALTFPEAVIVAIEPEESNFALLRRNVEGLNVRCLKAALSSSEGSARVVDPGEGHWGYRTEASTDTAGIPCVTIPHIFHEERWKGVFPLIVKIDIEGGEGDVFSRNIEWVKKTPLVIIELHDWLMPKGATSRPFLQCVAGQERDFIIVGENIFSIVHSLRDAVYG